jgi:hypothetical protein
VSLAEMLHRNCAISRCCSVASLAPHPSRRFRLVKIPFSSVPSGLFMRQSFESRRTIVSGQYRISVCLLALRSSGRRQYNAALRRRCRHTMADSPNNGRSQLDSREWQKRWILSGCLCGIVAVVLLVRTSCSVCVTFASVAVYISSFLYPSCIHGHADIRNRCCAQWRPPFRVSLEEPQLFDRL